METRITKKTETMMKAYCFLVKILSLIVLPVIFFIRVIQKKDVASWKIKLSNFNLPENFNEGRKTIMIHGVSVGEIVSLEKLFKRVKLIFPDCNLVITTGTKTGQEIAKKKAGNLADFITYFPLDIPSSVKSFLDKINPDVILITETEIWPVFAYEAAKENIPLYIINGRMSDESYKSYEALKPFFKNVLSLYSGIFTQSEIDKMRLINCGANEKKVEVMKNLKFDVDKFEVNLDLNKGSSKVLIAGSTHRGEDEIVLETFKKLKEKNIDVKLLLAPRHITRCGGVEELIKKFNFSYNLYSKNPSFEYVDILLLNVMGELAKLYAISDIAFIGGSFNNTGGHNPLEAIIFNKPVISGPSIKNFRDIYAILSTNSSAKVVKNKEEFFEYLYKLLTDDEFYKKASKDTKTIFDNQQGALEFVIEKLKACL